MDDEPSERNEKPNGKVFGFCGAYQAGNTNIQFIQSRRSSRVYSWPGVIKSRQPRRQIEQVISTQFNLLEKGESIIDE